MFGTIRLLTAALALLAVRCVAQEHVILVHGLCRSTGSMKRVERTLVQAGYRVSNVGYPSRAAGVEELAENVIGPAVERCLNDGAITVHFVTHSLGGVLVRSYLKRHEVPKLGRVVMLGPPNQGSELVDRLGKWWLFNVITGRAGQELGTHEEALPNRLGPVCFPLGVIAGNRSINWINSLAMLPGPDDGKVAVERTKVAGMSDHLVLPVAHPFLPVSRAAIWQSIFFLQSGEFYRAAGRD